MPIGLFENELTVQLWQPVTIRGFTFNVGDNLTLDQTKVDEDRGRRRQLRLALRDVPRPSGPGAEFAALWNRLPPPLLREGKKVQTPWLTAFLKDPYPIRPAVNLRMPRFHFGTADDAAARRDRRAWPTSSPRATARSSPTSRSPSASRRYLAELEAKHPDYLGAGWTMMTQGAPCVQCHAIGQYKPTGGDQVVNGPDLRQVAPRFRPGYLERVAGEPEPAASPTRRCRRTSPPHGPPPQIPVPKTFEDQPLDMVKAIRDTLLNYVNAVEQQLAGAKPDAVPRPPRPAGRPNDDHAGAARAGPSAATDPS